MRFQAAHKTVSYALVATALATLAVSEATTVPTAALLFGLTAASWFFDAGTWRARVLDRVAVLTILAIVVFSAASVWEARASFEEGDPTPVLNMVLGLLVYKLFHRRSNRDLFQIYVLTFLLMLAASVLAHSIMFAVGFSAYVIVGVWTLILFHLRREMEDNYLVKHSREAPSEKVEVDRILNSRRVVGPKFFAVTALVSLTVLLGAASTFAIVPRIGAGFLFGGVRKGARNVVGFSDQVVLGQHGVISSDNQTVILRAQVPRIAAIEDATARDAAISTLYWRGTVYDSYVRGQWERSRAEPLRTLLNRNFGQITIVVDPQAPEEHRPRLLPILGTRKVPSPGAEVPAPGVDRQEIELVGLSQPVAFGLDRPLAYATLPEKPGASTYLAFGAKFSGEVSLRVIRRYTMTGRQEEVSEFSGARYVAFSRDPLGHMDPRAGLPLGEIDDEDLAPYLEVPASLSPRVRELALRLTAGKKTPSEKMTAIVDWLHKSHTYTTTLQRDPTIADPLEDFLFKQTAGHCEYFASALAVLLRLAGVPSRYINGFLGGEWNEIGRHITVRDNRAHSWVEAYLGPYGWVRTDATPAGAPLAAMSRVRQLLDEMDRLWSRWVMDYDLSRQIDLARRIGQRFGLDKTARKTPGARHWSAPDKTTVLWSLALAGALYVAFDLFRRWRRLRLRGGSDTPVAAAARGLPIGRLYRRALDRLARRGLARRPSETPRDLARRVRGAGVMGADVMERLAELYAAARFGGRSIDDDVVDELARRLRDLGRPLPHEAAKPAPRPPA